MRLVVTAVAALGAAFSSGSTAFAGGPALAQPARTAAPAPAPRPPTGLTAAVGEGNSVVLSWSSDDVGVAGHEVLRDGAVVASVRGNHAVDRRAEPHAESCYTVRALNAAGNRSTSSDEVCVERGGGIAGGPANLHGEATSDNEVILQWDPPLRGAAAYVVYWERGGDRRVAMTPRTTFKVFGPAARERHCYRVAALDDREGESPKTPPVCMSALMALSAR